MTQDGRAEEDTDVAEITGLMAGPGTGRAGCAGSSAG